jgi:phage I-like protein
MTDQPAGTTGSVTPVTETKNEKPPEKAPVPYERFTEVNEAKLKAEAELSRIQKEQKDETEKRLAEQNQFKELAEKRGDELVKANEKAAKVEAYEKTLTEVLAAQVEALPEDKRGLVPDELTTQQKLSWIAKNAAILKAPASFDIGAGHLGGSGTKGVELTQEEIAVAKQFGMKPEDYAKNK